MQFTTALLYELFGKDTLGPMPLISIAPCIGHAAGQKWPMISQVHSLDLKRTIFQMAAERGKEGTLQSQGQKINIYPDLTADQWKQHAAFNEIRDLLWKTKLKYGIVHPAKMLITCNDETRSFMGPSEAMDFYTKVRCCLKYTYRLY